jgi:hypothetical protein
MSLARYERVPSADLATNYYRGQVIGNKEDAAVYTVGTTKSAIAYLKGILASVASGAKTLNERVVVTAPGVMTNGDTIFTIAGGPIIVEHLFSECIVTGGTEASTVQYSYTHAVMGAVTISNATGSTASSTAQSLITCQLTALNTPAVFVNEGVALASTGPSKLVMNEGTITLVIGTGPTTSTWRHFLRYKPMIVGVTVV